ncbi:cytochrome C oxidase subunit III [Williamsia sp. 1138]|uniref:cytochrome c oxidase subunit 3 n=1 Tax=Williamsia sp. 1138 TaxID=1903117 RepID=UPI000A11FD47|nr:cytochrome c oxidase subunit 3 [Williamsia sp. 1138]OZG28878.1 cytochrome C oxidase subunit III [Williamsia sp. 1138]
MGDMVVFAAFFTIFLVERGKDPDVFETAQRQMNLGLGLAMTVVLLTSSLFVYAGLTAIRSHVRSIGSYAFAAALTCGLIFVALKILEYTQKLDDGHGPGSNTFYQFYFVLTGLHLFHVLLGIGVLAALVRQARRDTFGATRMGMIESGASFWHLVDLLWIMLFPLLYVVS